MKDLDRNIEMVSDSTEFTATDERVQSEMQSRFESNVVPFREKVGKEVFDKKVESKKFSTGAMAETLNLLEHMYGVHSWKEGHDKLTQLRAEKDFILSTMVAKAQNALGIGLVSKQVLALESQISNLSSLIKKLPAEKDILALKNPELLAAQDEVVAAEVIAESSHDDVEYKQAA